jgi:hypothetical protein
MIILFNGPPGSGKDAAADFFKEKGFKHLSFKYQLFKETISFFAVDEEWFMSGYKDRSRKELPEDLLEGMSRREAMIYVSEEITKPALGQDIFGNLVANEIDPNKDYCISDGGFIDEVAPVINKVGSENFILVQLARDGCDYSSDSRRYLDGNLFHEYINTKATTIEKKYVLPHKFEVKMYRIHNNGNIGAFYEVLKDIYEKEVHETRTTKQREACT